MRRWDRADRNAGIPPSTWSPAPRCGVFFFLRLLPPAPRRVTDEDLDIKLVARARRRGAMRAGDLEPLAAALVNERLKCSHAARSRLRGYVLVPASRSYARNASLPVLQSRRPLLQIGGPSGPVGTRPECRFARSHIRSCGSRTWSKRSVQAAPLCFSLRPAVRDHPFPAWRPRRSRSPAPRTARRSRGSAHWPPSPGT